MCECVSKKVLFRSVALNCLGVLCVCVRPHLCVCVCVSACVCARVSVRDKQRLQEKDEERVGGLCEGDGGRERERHRREK